ncbi:MAG: hypothetical protein AAF802_08245, partial [Planctomycetota bacterium]
MNIDQHRPLARPIIAARMLAGLFLAMTTVPASAVDRWTNLNGTRTIEADFIGLWGTNVVLEMAGQRRVTVDIDDLIAESRILARQRAEEKRSQRQNMMAQIVGEAEEASAPAPNPIPKPIPAPPYKSAPLDQGLLATLDWANAQIRNGHLPRAMFELLSFEQQADLERVARKALAKVDVKGLEQTIRPIHSIGDL